MKKKNKDEKPPDLWINETDKMEMKPLNPDKEFTSTAVSRIPIRYEHLHVKIIRMKRFIACFKIQIPK